MEIGSKLKTARQQAEYTQEQAAAELKVSRQTISHWENNKSYPDLSLVIKMSEMYNISLDALLKENAGYTNYIKENTEIKKLKIHLSVVIEVLLYCLVWGGILLSYYLMPEESDWVSYTVLVYVLIFPPIIFLFSAIIGADNHWGKFKWFLIPILALSVCFMIICTFQSFSPLTIENLFWGFVEAFLPFATISFIGMLIGHILYGVYVKKKAEKEANNGTGN